MTCFQNLRSALEEIFSATVQNEDELDYGSATLILAGLLQMHVRFPRFASHRARLDSFPCSNLSASSFEEFNNSSRSCSPHPSALELASAGFFHTGSADETVCPACGLGLTDWQPTDQPETCHLAYSAAEVGIKSDERLGRWSIPVLPCLYLAVHRLLCSEIPLARKSLVPGGSFQSVCSLPGIITPPCSLLTADSHGNNSSKLASLSDRLNAIAGIMNSPPSPQGWPIENARALGHSDDIIVLALWRLQAESTRIFLNCPNLDALRLDPQATSELLRAILHLQEGFDANNEFSTFDSGSWDGFFDDNISQSSDNTELTPEDVETAALSRCANQRIRCIASSNNSPTTGISADSMSPRRVRLPPLCQFLRWWSNRWSTHSHTPK